MTQSNNVNSEPKFWLGEFTITDDARHKLDMEDVLIALRRHHDGDWGDLCAEDKAENETALTLGGRLFSMYRDRNEEKFWIITQPNRDTTPGRTDRGMGTGESPLNSPFRKGKPGCPATHAIGNGCWAHPDPAPDAIDIAERRAPIRRVFR